MPARPPSAAAAAAAGALLRTAPGLRLRSWGGDSDVAYSAGSRSTHLVDAGAGAVLQALLDAGGTLGFATLLCRLQSTADADAEAGRLARGDEAATLERCIEGLIEAGLVSRAAA